MISTSKPIVPRTPADDEHELRVQDRIADRITAFAGSMQFAARLGPNVKQEA